MMLRLAAALAAAISLAASADWRGAWSIQLTTSELQRDGAPESLGLCFENRGEVPLGGSNATFGVYRGKQLFAWAVAPALRYERIDLRPGEHTVRTVPWAALQFSGRRGENIAPSEVARAMEGGTWSVMLTLSDDSTPKPATESNLTVWSNPCKLGARGDYDALQGAWVVTHINALSAPLHEPKFVFDSDRFHLGGDSRDQPFVLDESSDPKSIDFGNDSSVKGIYKLEGDVLALCLAAPGAGRPARFETDRGSGVILIVVRRSR